MEEGSAQRVDTEEESAVYIEKESGIGGTHIHKKLEEEMQREKVAADARKHEVEQNEAQGLA